MKNRKSLNIITGIMTFAVMFLFISSAFSQNTVNSDPKNEQVYTCSICKDVTSNKPGDCPKCGMSMVLKNDQKSDSKTDMNCGQCSSTCCTMDNCCKGDLAACKDCCSTMNKDSKMNGTSGCSCCGK